MDPLCGIIRKMDANLIEKQTNTYAYLRGGELTGCRDFVCCGLIRAATAELVKI